MVNKGSHVKIMSLCLWVRESDDILHTKHALSMAKYGIKTIYDMIPNFFVILLRKVYE